jgi:hypothetical protein
MFHARKIETWESESERQMLETQLSTVYSISFSFTTTMSNADLPPHNFRVLEFGK